MNTQSWLSSADTRAERKTLLRELLLKRDLERIARETGRFKDVERLLNSLLFDREELVRWRAIEAFGRIAAIKAQARIESVREKIRRLLWAMNDESGNSLQHAPQLMGEILANVPELIGEFALYLPSFLDSPLHKLGAYWAMARVAAIAPTAFDNFSGMLIHSLSDPDPEIRGLALRALSISAGEDAVLLIRSLQSDPAGLRYYDAERGEFHDTTVREIANQRLSRL